MELSNPFSSCHIRPSAGPYLFSDGRSVVQLAQQLCDQHGWGQILGPHGSGKSTLISDLVTHIGDLQPVYFARLGSHHRRLPWTAKALLRLPSKTQVVIDGFEQLPVLQRWLVSRLLRHRNRGLLVTCHVDCGLPILRETRVTPELARRIARRLLSRSGVDLPIPNDLLSRLLHDHDGNLREVFFTLYDWYARQQHATPASLQT